MGACRTNAQGKLTITAPFRVNPFVSADDSPSSRSSMARMGSATAMGLLAAWLVSATPVSAKEPPIFVDPDSPAGVEYQLPLQRARQEAAGDADQRASGSGSTRAPLFGVGIDQAGGESGRAGGDPADAEGAGDGGAGGVNDSERGSPGTEGSRPRQNEKVREGGAAALGAAPGSTDAITAGIAAAVLALGLALGFGLRRMLRD